MGGDAAITRPVSNSREKSLWLPRFRKRGEKILHSKYIVICVIFLTISDCALVIGELIIDLYTVKISLLQSERRTRTFMDGLQTRYPNQFLDERMADVDYVMDRILNLDIHWNNINNNTSHDGIYTSVYNNHTRHKRNAQNSYEYQVQSPSILNGSLPKSIYNEGRMEHTREEYIAHCLHYASLTVLSILLIEVSLKILCAGSHFVKRKIEVFDAVIILLSFIVDLIFLKGLSDFAMSDSIFILAFLLPWRVIRVVNSLVVAVIDHEHVKLRLLYSRKKKLDKTVDNLRNEVDELKGLLHEVRSFCVKDGMDEWKLDNLLGKFAPRRRKDSKFYTLVKLVMSTASVADDKESVSSGSMDLEIDQYTRRESVLNDYDGCSTSNENTVNSFNFLTVPGTYYDARSLVSDNEFSISSRRSSFDSCSRRSSVNDISIQIPEVRVTHPEVNTHIQSEIEVANLQLPPERKTSVNQVSPVMSRKFTIFSPFMRSKNKNHQHGTKKSRKSSVNHLTPHTSNTSSKEPSPSASRKKSSSKQHSSSLSINNSPTLSRNSSSNQLVPCLSRNNSSNQLSPTLSRNNSSNQLAPCLSRNNSSNQLAPSISRNNSSNQLTPCLSRNSSVNDLSEACKENRERVKRSPHRVNFALS